MLNQGGTVSSHVKETEQSIKDSFVQEEERPDIQGPVILHCLGCRQFIGDSFTYVDQDPICKTLTIQRKHGCSSKHVMHIGSVGAITDGDKLMTVTDRQATDYGCTYFELRCKCCRELLGKSYITTIQRMDHLRGFVTLNVDKLTLYELTGFAQDQSLLHESGGGQMQDGNVMMNDISTMEQELSRLRLDITKVLLALLMHPIVCS
jgi:yippee zinc-binding/DNA-binding/Mis18 protein involved in centromere assembly